MKFTYPYCCSVLLLIVFTFIFTLLIAISSSLIVYAQQQQQTSSNSSSFTTTSTSSSIATTSTITTTTTTTTFQPKTRTKSRSLSASGHCGYFELYFGVPFFTEDNITLKEAVAQKSFTLPIFITLLAHIENGIIVFRQDDFVTTYWAEEPQALTDSIEILTGEDVVSIPHVRRRENWNREAVATWVIRPPKDMLENVGVAVEVLPEAFFCGLTWASVVPVGHVLLERRYSNSQIFFVRGMLTLGDVVSFLTAASSVAMVPHALQRSHTLALYFMCEIVDDMWYSVLENPFQMEIGEYHGSRPRGALIGNLLFCLTVYGALIVLAVCVTFWRRKRTLHWTWKRCLTLPQPQVDYKYLPFISKLKVMSKDAYHHFLPQRSLTSVRLPGILFIPYSVVVMGTSRASTELLRRSLNGLDIFLGLAGFLWLFVCYYFLWKKVWNRVKRETVSWVITVPEKDQKMETRFDRLCEFIRYNSFRFTTSPAAWFSRASTGEIKGGVAVTRSGGRVAADSNEENNHGDSSSTSDDNDDEDPIYSDDDVVDRYSNNSDDSVPSVAVDEEARRAERKRKIEERKKKREKKKKKQMDNDLRRFLKSGSGSGSSLLLSKSQCEKKFVEKYGSVFDPFHTLGYYWAAVDVVASFFVGLLTGLHPKLGGVGCAVTQLLLALTLSIYLACLCLARPWASLHNRLFAIIFATCNTAAIGINLFGSYTNDRSLQHRADTLDLATNGFALLKLFFDMVSLLLLPSLGGFFGYVFGSSSYQMMRQHAWEAEMTRREGEKQRKLEDAQWEADEEAEEEEPVQKPKPPLDEEEEEDEQRLAKKPKRDPTKKYKVVRNVRVVRRIYKPPPVDSTPVGSDNDNNDEEMKEQTRGLPSAEPNEDGDHEEEEQFKEEEEEEETQSEFERRKKRMSSLQRFMMI